MDDTASNAGACIARWLAHEVILSAVDHDRLANDRVRSRFQAKGFRMQVYHDHTLGIGLYVPQVSDVVFRSIRRAVGFTIGVKMSSRATGVRSAAVARLVNVESMFAGSQSRQVDFNVSLSHIFFKMHRALDGIALCGLQGRLGSFRLRFGWRCCLLGRLLGGPASNQNNYG